MLNIAIIGSGGREHALAWKLAQSAEISEIFVLPGNDAIANRFEMDILDFPAIENFCKKKNIGFIIVGSEAPLVAGIVDYFHERTHIKVFGPDERAAQLEGSKVWSKQFMAKYGVKTADFQCFVEIEAAKSYLEKMGGNAVIKYDGLAAGKGVFVCDDLSEAKEALKELKENYGENAEFIIEEKLVGDEISIIAVLSGGDYKLFHSSQDHKQLLDGDKGSNTGGMGAFCPVPFLTAEMLQNIENEVIKPTLEGLKSEEIHYNGFLYFGLMMTEKGPYLLEYNARLGDPETEVLLPSMETDLWEIIKACFEGNLAEKEMRLKAGYFVDVVLAAEGYPKAPRKGALIKGLDKVENDILVFHAGTKKEGENFYVNGGRVLNIVAQGENLEQAIAKAYAQVEKIHFEKMQYRKDIGKRNYKIFK